MFHNRFLAAVTSATLAFAAASTHAEAPPKGGQATRGSDARSQRGVRAALRSPMGQAAG